MDGRDVGSSSSSMSRTWLNVADRRADIERRRGGWTGRGSQASNVWSGWRVSLSGEKTLEQVQSECEAA